MTTDLGTPPVLSPDEAERAVLLAAPRGYRCFLPSPLWGEVRLDPVAAGAVREDVERGGLDGPGAHDGCTQHGTPALRRAPNPAAKPHAHPARCLPVGQIAARSRWPAPAPPAGL